jgi:uncharacterized protein GlcG (DUF336 family)
MRGLNFLPGRPRGRRRPPQRVALCLEPLEARTVLDAASDRAFLFKAYQQLLGRDPDPEALVALSGALAKGVSRNQVALLIEGGPEYRALEVDDLYIRYLGRSPEPGGLAAFTAFLAGGGRVEQAAAAITGSPEYFQTRGGSTDGFLDGLFLDALGRPIDPAARAAFDQALSHGVSRAQVATAVFSSPEYYTDLVQDFYLRFLNRLPDAPSLQLFLTALGQGVTDEQVIAVFVGADEFLPSTAPPPNLTTDDVSQLLARAAAATASTDGIIAIVDRNGRILGVRVEGGVSPQITGDPEKMTFAIDGAVAEARTGAFFGNDQAPLTSRTIQFISQSTITQREVDSDPNIPDPNSTQRGPGFVAPIGIKAHFPPGVEFTPQVDLFQIEHTNRDSIISPGPNHIRQVNAQDQPVGDDIQLSGRFNIDPQFVPSGKTLFAPESYGFVTEQFPTGQSRGIGTLPGGIPIYKQGQVVGGIGVFFPGTTGFASEENSALSSNYDPTKPDRSLEAEYIAYAALGGTNIPVTSLQVGTLDGIPPVPDIDPLPNGRIDLVGITLPLFGGPNEIDGPAGLIAYGKTLGQGDPNGGRNVEVDPQGDTLLAGQTLPDGFLVLPHAGTELSAADVTNLINQGIMQASQTRAAIRLPLDSTTRMVLAVADRNTGEILGLYRMPDATTFSIDVAVAKARNVAYYADPNQLQPIDQISGVPAGTAFTNRTFRYLAEPRFPEGIDGAPPGPFSILRDGGTDPATGLEVGPLKPASAFVSVQGFDSFNPQSNFRQAINVANQDGIVFFPGSAPLYVSGQLVGGLGISGDGVDQDDVVTFAGSVGYGVPQTVLRADQVQVLGIRLPYQKFNRKPQAG